MTLERSLPWTGYSSHFLLMIKSWLRLHWRKWLSTNLPGELSSPKCPLLIVSYGKMPNKTWKFTDIYGHDITPNLPSNSNRPQNYGQKYSEQLNGHMNSICPCQKGKIFPFFHHRGQNKIAKNGPQFLFIEKKISNFLSDKQEHNISRALHLGVLPYTDNEISKSGMRNVEKIRKLKFYSNMTWKNVLSEFLAIAQNGDREIRKLKNLSPDVQ